MARAVFFKSPRYAQKNVQLLIDDDFWNFFRVSPSKNKAFVRETERTMKKMAVVGMNGIKRNIQMMNAVATGFMRKSVTSEVFVNPGRDDMVKIFFGTNAWYDILVHEGLGRHGGVKGIPSRYMPTAEQLAIVEPDEKIRRKFWKHSPKVPRPFLKLGIKSVNGEMNRTFKTGMKKAFRSLSGGKLGIPKHDIKVLLGGGRF